MNAYICLIECFGMLLVYNTVFNRKTFKNIWLIIILALGGTFIIEIFNYLSIETIISMLFIIIVQGFILGIIDRKERFIISSELIISFVAVFLMEMLLACILNVFKINFNSDIGIVIILIILNLLLILFLNKVVKNSNINILLGTYKMTNFIIYNVLIFFTCLKVINDNDIVLNSVIIEIGILSIIFLLVNIQFSKYLYSTLEKNKKLEVQSQYNALLNELVSNFRANEHEYKNHLNTLSGLVQVLEGEELKEKVNEYMGCIQNNNYVAKLLNIDNVIIKAILYNKLEEASRNNIDFKYDIKSNLSNIPVDDSELTVILNNLINNAIEASLKCEKRIIELLIENNDNYLICIKNKINDFNINNISNMFKKGYSTKGQARGYGLYNIKKIVEKYRGTVQLSIEDDFLVISIIF